MAYQIYITEAFVCGSRNRNTSDKSVTLFTREAGMLFASVKSAREERSKHRYALQDFSLARVSLVRGRSGWRITGAEPVANIYFGAMTREVRTVIRNITRTLYRFLQGETPVPNIYDDIVGALRAPETCSAQMEMLLTLRVLAELGYVSAKGINRDLIEAKSALSVLDRITPSHETEGRAAIAQALELSHL